MMFTGYVTLLTSEIIIERQIIYNRCDFGPKCDKKPNWFRSGLYWYRVQTNKDPLERKPQVLNWTGASAVVGLLGPRGGELVHEIRLESFACWERQAGRE